MTWVLLVLLVAVTAFGVHAAYNYVRFRAMYFSQVEKYISLREHYNRTQHGYNQGVVEGMGKAYANVRADWIDRLSSSTPQERAFLVTWNNSPVNAWDAARRMMNEELRELTSSDHNYADLIASADPAKNMIKLGG